MYRQRPERSGPPTARQGDWMFCRGTLLMPECKKQLGITLGAVRDDGHLPVVIHAARSTDVTPVELAVCESFPG